MLITLLRFINERHGTAFAPGARYPTGEQGAFALTDGSGPGAARFVLKWAPGTAVPDDFRRAMAVTDRLRAVGYPAPRYRLVECVPPLGICYSVQDALPGAPMGDRPAEPILDRLLELNALQRDQAAGTPRNWPRRVVDTLLHGGDGYCLLDPLRTYSAATADLLSELQRLAATSPGTHVPTADVVHFDFQGANILVDRGEVTGVVDWEGCCAGDRAFDLATLYFYLDEDGTGRGPRERLWRLLASVDPPLLRLYLAHLILRQVDWSIRFHDRAAVERWLLRASEVLRRLSATGEGGEAMA